MMYLGSNPVGLTREGLANDISIIDDTAGKGDTLKVWSADRTSEMQTELDMLIEKKVVPPPTPTEITQVCDLSNATKKQFVSSQTYYYQNIKINFLWNGYYYPNPSNINLVFNGLKAYNANGEELQLYRNGSSTTSVTTLTDGKYLQRVDNRTFKVYQANGTLDWTYTTDGDIAYLNHSSSYVETNTDPDQLGGMTFGGSSTTYIPYGDSDESETETEYEYGYTDDLGDFAQEYISENYTDTEPTENSDNMVNSGGIYSAMQKQFEQSYNLIDESKFDWTPVGGYWYLEPGYYFNVTEGKKICSNFAKPVYQFYDETKTLISSGSVVRPFALVDIPADTVYCRMYVNANESLNVNIQGKVLVYEVDSSMQSNDDIRPYVPPKKIKGNLVEGDIYNTALPLNLDSDILKAAQLKSVRALNHQRDAFRIGTFNLYLPRGYSHWDLLKKEMKEFSADMCAFQEVANNSSENRVLQNYMIANNWQFAYASQPMFDNEYSQKAVVSAYQIVSTSHYVTSTDRDYIKCVINLPQYKHYDHQFTLSLYSYHGTSVSSALRVQEVEEILQTISSDTSDFIVVCGDTNAFETEADAQGKRPTWETWISGGFTPIHYGECQTVTADGWSIDQIFMGANVSCLYYDIVNSNKWTIDIAGTPEPISDHDFVYADLQFDFDAVIASLEQEGT